MEQTRTGELGDTPRAASVTSHPPRGRGSAGLFIYDIGSETGPLNVCGKKKFRRHPQMAEGGGRLEPRGFDWSAPSNTQGKKKKKKEVLC